MIALRLRQLADDCDERARNSPMAQAMFSGIARTARIAAGSPELDSTSRRAAFECLAAMANLARWFDGENGVSVDDQLDSLPLDRFKPAVFLAPPADRRSEIPLEALNPRQLAEHFTMNERTARRTIERAMRRGLPGFYREGRYWRAEPSAFEAIRGLEG